MVSLSTVYVISIVLTSLAGMGSAFVGNKVYPIQGGAVIPPPTPEDVRKATEEAAKKAKEYAEATVFAKKQAEEEKKEEPTIYASEEPPKEEEKPVDEPPKEEEKSLKDQIMEKFEVDDETAQAITDFVQTPVIDWKKIASSQSDLRRKFVKTMTHPDQNKCPSNLLDLCKIVYVKYSNMVNFINDDPTYVPYGDQTSEALNLLSNTE